jgi:8-oxo-dGTP diphosphatase
MWVDTGGWNGNIKTEGTPPPPPTVLWSDPLYRTAAPAPKKYVVGFMFSPSKRSVVLIRKNRPSWQAGKLNGVGGKIELTDKSPVAAMQREFQEETGVPFVSNWSHYATLHGPNDKIYVFRTFDESIQYAQTVTDEEVGKYFANDLPADVLPNLRFLIPLALTWGYAHTDFYFED